MKKLLTDTEAAIKLGITKELLYAYVRNAPKKHLGHDKKLITEVVDGINYFTEDALISFDEYLKEPWSEPQKPRPDIPKFIQDYLKTEIGGKCPISGKGYPLDNAHIVDYSESLSHHHHNLIRISKEEHTKADNGIIPKTVLRQVKDQLINNLRRELAIVNNSKVFQVPNPHNIFVGREKELLELTDAMEFERLVIVEGLGGIGKTELLINALKNVTYHNPVIWIDVEDVSSLNDLKLVLSNHLTKIAGQSIGDSLMEFLSSTNITIVFDSLEKLLLPYRDETEEFIEYLIKLSTTQILITSQVDLSILDHNKKVVQLKGITDEESILLIKELLPHDITITQGHLSWFIDFCNGHPLSLKLIVSLLRFYRSDKQVVALLSSTGQLNRPMRNRQNKSTSLEVCLSTIYDCLTTDQIEIIQYLKFFPGGIKTDWIKTSRKIPTLESDIAILRQFFFVEDQRGQTELDRIVVPNPLRPFLKIKASSLTKEYNDNLQKEAALNIMMEAMIVSWKYIEQANSDSLVYGLLRIEEEMPNLLEAFRISKEMVSAIEKESKDSIPDYLQIISGIASAIGKFCFMRGYLKQGLMFSKEGITVNLKQGNIETAALQYMYLAQVQSRLFDFDGLAETLEGIENLAEDTDNLVAKENASWIRGRFEFDRGNYDIARIAFEKALAIIESEEGTTSLSDEEQKAYSKFRKEDDRAIAGNIVLLKFEIAKTYEFSEKFEEAIKHHEEVLKEMLEGDDNGASFYNHYGHCLCKVGRFSEGINYYGKAIEGFKRTGQYEYLANSISDLGVFVEQYPSIAGQEILDEDTCNLALESLSGQYLNFIQLSSGAQDLKTLLDRMPMGLLGKTFHIMQLLSVSPHCLEMSKWVRNFDDEINLFNMADISYFSSLLHLAYNVGGVNHWKTMTDREKVIKSILQDCLIVNGGPDLKSKTRVFYWLATWMKFHNLDNEATAEKLLENAWKELPSK